MTPTEAIRTGGFRVEEGTTKFQGGGTTLLRIWKHECFRVFSDKLANLKDKATFESYLDAQMQESFGPDMCNAASTPFYMVNFNRPDVYDANGDFEEYGPKVYEPGGNLEEVRPLVQTFLESYNKEF